MTDKPRTIFIAVETTGFSGATLLSSLLGSHPSIATVGEMSGLIDRVNPDKYYCSCGQLIKICEFWTAVQKGMASKGYEFDVAHFNTKISSDCSSIYYRLREGSSRIALIDSIRDAALFALPGTYRRFKLLAERNVAFVETILEIKGKRVFLDTSKDRMRPKVLQRLSSLDTRIIHLVRDVRGVVASELRRNHSLTAAESARNWCRLHGRVEVTLESWPKDKQLIVRYEDLCRSPKKTMDLLCEFCGVDDYPEAIDIQHELQRQHLIGNPMRLNKVVNVTHDNRWKKELTQAQLMDIKRVSDALARKYGYS